MNIEDRMNDVFREAMITSQEEAVVAALRWFGPLTRPTLAKVTGIRVQNIYARTSELVAAGKIEVVGKQSLDGCRALEVLAYIRDIVDLAEEEPCGS